MANNITLATQFVPILDEVYKNASLTAKLDGASELVSQGANAGELIIPMLDMQGLGDYSRNDGYVGGDVTLTNETVKCNYDRGRMFNVDNMDNQESANIAFGRLAGEFIRTKVVPELDAFRFASYAGKAGISKVLEGATLSSGEEVLKAIRAATTQMDEDEVPMEDRHLFITPTLEGMIMDLETYKSKDVLNRFASKTLVPQTRFYTAIELKSGKNSEAAGGYTKCTKKYAKASAADPGALEVIASSGTVSGNQIKLSDVTPVADSGYTPQVGDYVVNIEGAEINFMIIHKPAVIQFEKHVAPKIISPDVNQTADAYKFGYRNVGIADVYTNKLAGIYLHHKAVE